MNDVNKTSLLIPAKGECKHLLFTLRSLQQSKIQPIEIILVDDGISADVMSSIRFFIENLPIVITKNQGIGLVSALNTGLKHAKGEYIARLDSDDEICENRIRIQQDILDKDSQIVAVGGNCYYIDAQNNLIGESKYTEGFLNSNPEFERRCIIAHPSVTFRLSAALDIDGYRGIFYWNSAVVAEDFDFWHNLKSKGLILVTSEKVIRYRKHSGQISNSNIRAQIVGTNYIAAIHKLVITSPVIVKWKKYHLKNFIHVFRTIKEAFGFKFMVQNIFLLMEAHFETTYLNNMLNIILFKIRNYGRS